MNYEESLGETRFFETTLFNEACYTILYYVTETGIDYVVGFPIVLLQISCTQLRKLRTNLLVPLIIHASTSMSH